MGQSGTKERSGGKGPKPGSDEWWWLEAEKTLAPIKTIDEFCARFKSATPDEAKQLLAMFNRAAQTCPKGENGEPVLTFEAWCTLEDGDSPELRKVLRMVFDAFDADRNGTISAEEFLVYLGLKRFGTLEQRVIGAFTLFDSDHDHRLRPEELTEVMRSVFLMVNRHVPEFKAQMEIIPEIVEILYDKFDTDKSGTLELCEVIKAARSDKNVAGIFNVI